MFFAMNMIFLSENSPVDIYLVNTVGGTDGLVLQHQGTGSHSA